MKKKISASIIFLAVVTLTLPICVQAQSTNQVGNLEILPNNVITVVPPDSFSFDPIFIQNNTSVINIYKTLDPQIENQTVKVIDTDMSRGFTLNISLTNLISTSNVLNIIPYTDVSLVTLANSNTTSIDYGPNNNPAISTMNAALDCNWDPQNANYPRMEDYCGPSMFSFTEPLCSGLCPLPTSNEVTIMENLNTNDVGEYSVGFGFQITLDDVINSGNYEGELTFTLIPN